MGLEILSPSLSFGVCGMTSCEALFERGLTATSVISLTGTYCCFCSSPVLIYDSSTGGWSGVTKSMFGGASNSSRV